MNALQTAGANAAAVAAVLAALAAIWRIPAITKLVHWVDKHRREDRTAALEKTMESLFGPRLEVLEVRTQELANNGGSSIKDTVQRIDVRLTDLTVLFDERGVVLESQSEQIEALSGDVRTVLKKVSLLEGTS